MAYMDELDEIMESICDRCRYVVEVDGQDELDEICAGCTIRDEIEHLANQKKKPRRNTTSVGAKR